MILKINDRIRTRQVEFFNQFSLNLRYDSIASGFSFKGYFNPSNIDLKEIYCVGHYHIVTLEHNGELLLTGNILSEAFDHANNKELVSFGGYSTPGVLEDCNIPPDSYPLQSDGLTLKEIATKLLKRFNLQMIIHSSVESLMNEPYEKTTAEATSTIKDYLTSLANQKNIVISHDAMGRIIFTKANTNRAPLLDFNLPGESTIPFTKMNLSFNGQGMHSHIHVIKEPDPEGGNAGESVIRNPYVISSVYRPKVIIQNSGTDIDTDKVARMALAAELKNLKLVITTDRWELNGKILKPNNIITVVNPEVYLYKKSKWFIEEIEFQGNNKEVIAKLTCCPPEVYNDNTPEYLFKGINLH
jgi:prophage tail gpP-like protein